MGSVVKFGFFTLLYVVISFLLTNDIICAFSGNTGCIRGFLVKYIVFMVVLIAYDKWMIKKKKDKK